MYLRYLESAPQSEALLMQNGREWRVELYVLANNDHSYSLVALSGSEQLAAERVKVQGPYSMRAQALAARSAIAAELQQAGYHMNNNDTTQWRLQAQGEIRRVRELRERHRPDCRFDPKDVL